MHLILPYFLGLAIQTHPYGIIFASPSPYLCVQMTRVQNVSLSHKYKKYSIVAALLLLRLTLSETMQICHEIRTRPMKLP